MRDKSLRLTVAFRESELPIIEQAAHRLGMSVSDYASYALSRMATQELGHGARAADLNSERYPSRRSLRPVRERALMPMPEVVRQLREFLGPQLLSLTVDASVDQIKSWAREDTQPQGDHERRLREAHEVWQLVVSVESSKTTRAWWMSMKDGLDDLSPAEAIAKDQAAAVMSVARDFLEAG
ncbi:hypothetical protein L332_00075 [Agrococcus pavilionensis RW1]|uniref:Antitoxin Xre/MbcA/ParS-like toxin-binding domain-containing protein n=1 Tax=Agrococcus pavilionensis RW1 TaxID=1330458 RepID=U1MLX3_9MICO|nr:hypothetical protein [Agrococcus pavilionensis]ERG62866.1 hypothetical protein L332_00075 [Agrococcus pavilionensis RW1]